MSLCFKSLKSLVHYNLKIEENLNLKKREICTILIYFIRLFLF